MTESGDQLQDEQTGKHVSDSDQPKGKDFSVYSGDAPGANSTPERDASTRVPGPSTTIGLGLQELRLSSEDQPRWDALS